jgi:hypothetical protein
MTPTSINARQPAYSVSRYHVPEVVRDHVDYITPGIKLMAEGHGGSRPRTMADANEIKPRVDVDSMPAPEKEFNVASAQADAPEVDCRQDLVPDCVRGASPLSNLTTGPG